jgi:hypothetical protein
MRETRPLPSREDLLATFGYDPETGILRWKAPRRKIRVGDIAGAVQKSGHVAVGGRKNRAYAHRIIWKMMTGEEPPEIDHRDTDGSNNRWGNLRASDRAGNNRNQRKLTPGTSGFKGVHWSSQKQGWVAKIMANRKSKHLGTFEDEGAAARAYQKASPIYHGAFGNVSSPTVQ